MTGPEVAELAKTTDLAVLPIGSIETHGPHLPNGSDSFIAERVCELIAEAVPCIVLPTMYYNICAMMKGYPGGAISIPPDVMIQLYDAIFRECARHGFNKNLRGRLPRRIGDARAVPGEHGPRARHVRSARKAGPARLLPVQQDAVGGGRGEIRQGHPARSWPWRRNRDCAEVWRAGPSWCISNGSPKTVRRTAGAVSANYHIDWINQVPLAYVGNPRFASQETADKFMEAVAADFIQAAREITAYKIGVDV